MANRTGLTAKLAAIAAGLAMVSIGGVVLLVAVVAGIAGSAVQADQPPAGPSAAALTKIPPGILQAAQTAAATCPGLDWTVLAAIAAHESGFDSTARNPSGAMGLMQFRPATWATYGVDGDGDGAPNPFNPIDALFGGANYLCHLGAASGPSQLAAALFQYTGSGDDPAADVRHPAQAPLVQQILAIATSYRAQPVAADAPATAQAAIAFALSKLGVAYLWGGTGNGGYDCSGLTQAAYASAGIALPRTSQAQAAAGPRVPLEELQPGDLVFFDEGGGDLGHVGIYLGNSQMIDAPHTGAVVRIETLWPSLAVATRPALSSDS